jgi:hypothetical protein
MSYAIFYSSSYFSRAPRETRHKFLPTGLPFRHFMATTGVVQKSVRSIQQRIIAIPLTRSGRPRTSAKTPLLSEVDKSIHTYYDFQIHKRSPPPPKNSETKPKSSWLPEEGIVKWAQVRILNFTASKPHSSTRCCRQKLARRGARLVRLRKGLGRLLSPSIALPESHILPDQSFSGWGTFGRFVLHFLFVVSACLHLSLRSDRF